MSSAVARHASRASQKRDCLVGTEVSGGVAPRPVDTGHTALEKLFQRYANNAEVSAKLAPLCRSGRSRADGAPIRSSIQPASLDRQPKNVAGYKDRRRVYAAPHHLPELSDNENIVLPNRVTPLLSTIRFDTSAR